MACTMARHAVRPDFYLPAFGIAGALGSHRTVSMMATIALNGLSGFGGLAFVIQWPALRTGDGVGRRVIMKMLRRVGIVVGRLAFRRRGQHVHLLLGRRLQIGPAAIAGVGER